ncbi:C10 family peptidase [Pedobacter sp.]
MKNKFCFLILLGAFLLLVQSCTKENHPKLDGLKKIDSNFVDLELANKIAYLFANQKSEKKALSVETQSDYSRVKHLLSVKELKDVENVTVLYVVNYKEGGFAVLSADRRTPQVLAYSDENYFPTDTIRDGVDFWINGTKEMIREIRKSNLEYKGQDRINLFGKSKSAVLQVIKENDGNYYSMRPPLPPPCEDYSEAVGPLLTTKWSQGMGYNNRMPFLSSCDPIGNGRAYTGCVATAMAQVVRYYQSHPNWFNYSIMHNSVNYTNYNGSGTDEIAKLMALLANSVNASYSCTGTGAYTETEVPYVFKNYWGFSTSIAVVDWPGNSGIVVSNLRNGWPVIFKGAPGANQSGHAWVCDGFVESTYCDTGSTLLALTMNWGWGGDYNGNYGFANFNPAGTSYNYGAKAIINIHP